MQRILAAIGISYKLPELEEMARDVESPVQAFEDAKVLIAAAENPELYSHLSIEEGRKVALAAIERYDTIPTSKDFLPQIILINLSAVVPGTLNGMAPLFLERRLAFREEQIFREADPATRDRIVELVESGTSPYYTREQLLNALAWNGDEPVQRLFHQWRSTPPVWQTSLTYPLDHYPTHGGWELTLQGNQRLLYYQANYDLVPDHIASRAENSRPVKVIRPHEGVCGWCGLPLITLFDIDLQDPRMQFLEMPGTRLRLVLCFNCTRQGPGILTEVDGEGKAVWSAFNGEPWEYLSFPDAYTSEASLEELLDDFPQRNLVLGEARNTPYMDHGSHLGGCPEWVQDAAYPHYPQCQRRMRFVGQYVYLAESYIFYAFLCVSCGLASTTYQQT